VKTEVYFHSTAFNCTEPRDYFVNECCFGDDLARWMIERLRAQGIETAEQPGMEDFGWFFTFHSDGVEHSFVIGFQPNDAAKGDRWFGSVERSTGFVSSLFGGRNRGILPSAIEAIDAVFKSSPDIHSVTWHERGEGDEA
jgi:hypothetical protein